MKLILNWIEEAKTICVFRHQNPDADALGSQFGLVTWLQQRYPEKTIHAMGFHRGTSPELFGEYEQITDEKVQSSLAIILDTANASRIDDERYLLAHKRIKIDHHPFVEVYADYEWIDEHAASTSELVTEFIHSVQEEPLPKKIARYLYMGIIADTLRFSTRNTRSKTLEQAAFLVQSHLDLAEINDDLFALDHQEYALTTYIRSTAVFEPNGLAYLVLHQDDLKRLGVSQGKAKEKVVELGLMRSVKIWALFIEQEDMISYNGSLRSRHLTINDIAKAYRGGGHKLAAAVKECSLEEIQLVLHDLRERLKEMA